MTRPDLSIPNPSPSSLRITARDKAAAADRFIDVEEDAHRAIEDMLAIVRERRSSGVTGPGPLFPYIGVRVITLLERSAEALYEAHKLVAVQAYDERRKAEQEAEALA